MLLLFFAHRWISVVKWLDLFLFHTQMFAIELTSSVFFSSSSVFYMDSFTCQSYSVSPPPRWDMLDGTLASLSHSTMLQIMKTVCTFYREGKFSPCKVCYILGATAAWQVSELWCLFRIFTSAIGYSLILFRCPAETVTRAGRGPSGRWVRGDGSWWGRRRCPATLAPRLADLSSKG